MLLLLLLLLLLLVSTVKLGCRPVGLLPAAAVCYSI